MDPMDPTDEHATESPRLGLRYAALSDVGRVRKDNQDSGFASEHLLVIADGVGGAARGDVASSTAVQALRRLDGPPPADLLEALAGAIHRAHDRIAELVEQDPELDGTSTTVTAALFDGHRIGLAHIGDSRGYLLREGTLSQLTKDHTFVQSLIDEGRITEEESRTHPHRNLILRAVDGVHETDPDLFYIELVPGDRLLLCSDGASGVLDHPRLADILASGSIDYATVELIRASLEAGSSDNITCVVADVVDPGVEDDGPPLAAASTGPMVVGAAAEQPRRAGQGSKSFFRGHRSGDTGEIDPVPGDEGDGTPVDPEELRYAPQAPRRRRRVTTGIALLVLALVAAVVGVVAYRWSQRQYYVAADSSEVAIYRGVQASIPGLTMNHVAQKTDVTIASLPDFPAEQVRSGISATSLADAREIVSRLGDAARVCPTPTPTPTPAPTPTLTPTRKPGDAKPSATPSPTAAPTPTPSASPTLAPPDCVEATP
ncbi:MAG: protein phosphatase 2C domain-containing protein [Nocardioidaceae bacterium]